MDGRVVFLVIDHRVEFYYIFSILIKRDVGGGEMHPRGAQRWGGGEKQTINNKQHVRIREHTDDNINIIEVQNFC